MMHRVPRRILFLHPKTLYDSWPFTQDTLGEVVKVPSLVYPLLAATVETLPVDIEIFDGYVAPESFRNYKARLARADVIAITVMTPMKALDTELTLRLIRKLNPGAVIVLGGNHASAFPQQWIERGADYVIVRDGEVAFPRLIRCLLGEGSIEDVPNLVHASGATTVPAPMVSLEDTPLPAWHLMDLTPYRPRLGAHGLAATLEISRGCVFRCEFCNINRFWNYKQRYKSVERVLEEMDRLHALGVRQIFFADDNFGFDHDHTLTLFETLVRRGSPFRLGAFIRGDTIFKHPEFADLAGRAGLRLALMGIETLDPQQLKAYRKGVRARDVEAMWGQVYQRCRQNNIFVLGLFLNSMQPSENSVRCAGQGTEGKVCDFYYASDLIPQRNSLLYERMQAKEASKDCTDNAPRPKLKDMFYHDWNLPSVDFGTTLQANTKRLGGSAFRLRSYFLRGFVSRRRLRRHFAWVHVGLFLERLLCTRGGDVRRYRWAKDNRLDLGERQRAIIASILNDDTVERLVRSRTWRGPLAIRHSLAGFARKLNGISRASTHSAASTDKSVWDFYRSVPPTG